MKALGKSDVPFAPAGLLLQQRFSVHAQQLTPDQDVSAAADLRRSATRCGVHQRANPRQGVKHMHRMPARSVCAQPDHPRSARLADGDAKSGQGRTTQKVDRSQCEKLAR